MARTSESPPATGRLSRYMTFEEVAEEFGWKSRGPVYDLVHSGQLDAAPVGSTGRGLRVTRKSFEAYCSRIEEEGRRRFRAAS